MKKRGFFLFLLAGLAVFCGTTPFAQASAPRYEQGLQNLSNAMASYRKLKDQFSGYDVVFRRDPMRSLVDANGNFINVAGLESGFALQGIVQSPGLNLVLVNDQFLAEGAQVGAYKILKIESKGVTAQRGKETLFIPLYSQENTENS